MAGQKWSAGMAVGGAIAGGDKIAGLAVGNVDTLWTFTQAATFIAGALTTTGTGSTFVLQTSPTLITPVLGVATGTSLAITNQIWSGSVSTALTTLTGAIDGFRASAANASQLAAENTTNSGATAGGLVGMYSNDGAAMASGDRLGGLRMGGSSSASALRNSAGVFAFADQAWVDASAYGSRLEFQTTTNTTTALSTKAILSNAGLFALGATLANTAPGIKPSSTTLAVRLGDDSADAPLSAAAGTFSGTVSVINSTAPQRINIYEDAESSNTIYSRAFIDAGAASAGVLIIGSEHAGSTTSGTNLTKMQFNIDGVNKLDFAVTTAAVWTSSVALQAATFGAGGSTLATGAMAVNTSHCSLWNGGNYQWSNDTTPNGSADLILRRAAAATLQFGAADVNGSAVAQTLRAQSAVTGTDQNAANFTIQGSRQTGAGSTGQLIFQTSPKLASGATQGSYVTALTFTAPAVNMQPSTVLGNQALATTATDGFLYICTGAGAPSGVPTAFTGRVALYYDTTGHQLYIYDGAWLQPKTPAAAATVTWQ